MVRVERFRGDCVRELVICSRRSWIFMTADMDTDSSASEYRWRCCTGVGPEKGFHNTTFYFNFKGVPTAISQFLPAFVTVHVHSGHAYIVFSSVESVLLLHA